MDSKGLSTPHTGGLTDRLRTPMILDVIRSNGGGDARSLVLTEPPLGKFPPLQISDVTDVEVELISVTKPTDLALELPAIVELVTGLPQERVPPAPSTQKRHWKIKAVASGEGVVRVLAGFQLIAVPVRVA